MKAQKQDKEVMLVEKQIYPLVEKATEFRVKSSDDMIEATELLSRMNIVMDRVTTEKEKITRPALDILAIERARWAPIEKAYKSGIAPLRAEISRFQTEEVKRQEEEEAKIAARVGAGKGKLKFETAIDKINEVERPADLIKTKSGILKFRTDSVVKVVDFSKIPQEYLLVNERLVLDDLKAGKKVPGCELDFIQTPVNSR